MYLATFVRGNRDGADDSAVDGRSPDPSEQWAVGVADGPDAEHLVDLTALDLPARWQRDIVSILGSGDAALDAIRAAVAQAPESARRALSDVQLLAPVPRPGKVICIGLNYRDHAEETGQPIPTTPVVFSKFSTAVTGPFAPIVYPEASKRVDYEGEFGVVIGRRTRWVSPDQAPGAIAGFLVINDVSARDVQNATSQWTLGKTFDTFAPMGPFLATADEVADPHRLDISTTVNGEVRQHSNTSNLIFDCFALVSRLSQVCTLEPGDVIATGTPAGVGIGFDPERLLSVGDRVSVRIEGLGEISSVVVAEDRG
jgi:2-keto-4-pentenoate hydratase/2-oxohepta-3-ene-1,7-dioic acid hydratase in catechol pathway